MTDLSVLQDRTLIRSTYTSSRFLRVEVAAPPPRGEAHRPPMNLALGLDRSGSMGGEKIALAKEAVLAAIDRLMPGDRFAVVAYDDLIDVLAPSTAATPAARAAARDAVMRLDARGSTNLGEGWLRGCQQVADSLVEGGVNRVLLLTDGLANVGMVSTDELAGHAAELRRRGVVTTTFGVGEDFDDGLLRAMADAGGGHFRYIENARQIPDHIAGEVGELLEVAARDVVLEVTGPVRSVEPLSPYPVEGHGERCRIRLGDLVSDQVVEVILRLRFPYGRVGSETGVLVAARSADGAIDLGRTVRWTYADDLANDRQPRERAVDRPVARAFAARARSRAVELNRGGQYEAAREALLAVARRIGGYAGSDPELNDLVAGLRRDAEMWAVRQAEGMRKSAVAASYYTLKSRAPMGEAMRRSR
jgi:Ca-activated chloride channel family protein